MEIDKLLLKRFYVVLALIYAIFAFALCIRAPVVQGDIFELIAPAEPTSSGTERSKQSSDPYSAIPKPSDPNTSRSSPPGDIDLSAGLEPYRPQPSIEYAPLWALGSNLALDVPRFALNQALLLGTVLIIALAYRFRARLAVWVPIIPRFFASRRTGTCIWLGFIIVLLFSLFPPWLRVRAERFGVPVQRTKLWHAPIYREPVGTTRRHVDYPRMLTEIAVGECFVLALYLTWARGKQKDSRRV